MRVTDAGGKMENKTKKEERRGRKRLKHELPKNRMMKKRKVELK